MSLRRDAVWTGFDAFASSGISFMFRLLVARFLSPHEFGLAAIALTIVAVLQVINDFGLTATLIQRDQDKVTDRLVNTTFTLSVIVSACLFIVVVLVVAPVASMFYSEPDLLALVAVMGVSLLPSPFTTVASALLLRERRFKTVAISRVLSVITSTIGAATLLLFTPTAWVVIVQFVAASTIASIVVVHAAKWKFRIVIDKQARKEVLRFSSFILANDLTLALSANVGVFVVARVVGTAEAGLYSLAIYLTDIVRRSLMNIFNRVMFVHYSKSKKDFIELRRSFIASLTWNCRIIFPVMTATICAGPALANMALGPEWREMGPALQWLALSAMVLAAGGSTSTLYKAMGKPGLDLGLYVGALVLVILPSMITGALLYGLVGVAVATAVSRAIVNIVRQLLLDRLIGSTLKKAVTTVLRLLVLQLPIVAIWWIGRHASPALDTAIGQALLVAVGGAIYAAVEMPRAFPSLAEKIPGPFRKKKLE